MAVELQVPSASTLKKYGLSFSDWEKMANEQGRVCFVCEKLTTTGRLCIDHEHVKGWKKMPPEQRKLYVRGLVCWVCNHYYLGRGITIRKSERTTVYLKKYEARRPGSNINGNVEVCADHHGGEVLPPN